MELFQLDPGLALWTWVVFGVTFFILQKFAFPQILENIRDREMMISKAVHKAEQIEKRLSEIEKERDDILREAQRQANEILQQSRLHAESLKKDILKKAEEEAKAVLNEAKVKIDAERAVMFGSLKSEIADLVCDTSEKLIGQSFVEEKDRQWVKELIKTI